MTISVTFETAGLASAVGKAARVAPSKGMAFDKAAGILIEGRPFAEPGRQITIKATNLEVDYLEWVQPLEIHSDEDFDWRLPSSIFAGFCAGMPIGSGKTVTITREDHGGNIMLRSGKAKASINVMKADSYKRWEPFDPDALHDVKDFPARVAQAAWACDKDAVPFSGIHLTGTHIFATDKYRLVRTPCDAALEAPVTVPMDTLGPILKSVEDVRLGANPNYVLIMPDEYTQMRAIIYDMGYPNIEKIMDATIFNRVVTAPRIRLREALTRMTGLIAKGERYPIVTCTFTPDTIYLEMTVPSVGTMTDEVDISTETVAHPAIEEEGAPEEFVIHFTPTTITDCLDQPRTDTVSLGYRTDRNGVPVKVWDGLGFESWLMPRRKTDVGPVAE